MAKVTWTNANACLPPWIRRAKEGGGVLSSSLSPPSKDLWVPKSSWRTRDWHAEKKAYFVERLLKASGELRFAEIVILLSLLLCVCVCVCVGLRKKPS